jgi:hypothetical protein
MYFIQQNQLISKIVRSFFQETDGGHSAPQAADKNGVLTFLI